MFGLDILPRFLEPVTDICIDSGWNMLGYADAFTGKYWPERHANLGFLLVD